MSRIETHVRALGLNDITEDWKIVAESFPTGWKFFGTLADKREHDVFFLMAFPGQREQPHISTVQRRETDGQCVLLARIFPMKFRKPNQRN